MSYIEDDEKVESASTMSSIEDDDADEKSDTEESDSDDDDETAKIIEVEGSASTAKSFYAYDDDMLHTFYEINSDHAFGDRHD